MPFAFNRAKTVVDRVSAAIAHALEDDSRRTELISFAPGFGMAAPQSSEPRGRSPLHPTRISEIGGRQFNQDEALTVLVPVAPRNPYPRGTRQTFPLRVECAGVIPTFVRQIARLKSQPQREPPTCTLSCDIQSKFSDQLHPPHQLRHDLAPRCEAQGYRTRPLPTNLHAPSGIWAGAPGSGDDSCRNEGAAGQLVFGGASPLACATRAFR